MSKVQRFVATYSQTVQIGEYELKQVINEESDGVNGVV